MFPMVTLTNIAITLSNVANRMVEVLISSISEGIIYTSIIEKDSMAKADSVNNTNAAEVMWLGVELLQRQLDHKILRKELLKKKKTVGELLKVFGYS